MKSTNKHKFFALVDKLISDGILDEIIPECSPYNACIHDVLVTKNGVIETQKIDRDVDYVFVDLYKELIGKLKDKPPCIECSDFTIDNCAKTSCECIKFKRYACISKIL